MVLCSLTPFDYTSRNSCAGSCVVQSMAPVFRRSDEPAGGDGSGSGGFQWYILCYFHGVLALMLLQTISKSAREPFWHTLWWTIKILEMIMHAVLRLARYVLAIVNSVLKIVINIWMLINRILWALKMTVDYFVEKAKSIGDIARERSNMKNTMRDRVFRQSLMMLLLDLGYDEVEIRRMLTAATGIPYKDPVLKYRLTVDQWMRERRIPEDSDYPPSGDDLPLDEKARKKRASRQISGQQESVLFVEVASHGDHWSKRRLLPDKPPTESPRSKEKRLNKAKKKQEKKKQKAEKELLKTQKDALKAQAKLEAEGRNIEKIEMVEKGDDSKINKGPLDLAGDENEETEEVKDGVMAKVKDKLPFMGRVESEKAAAKGRMESEKAGLRQKLPFSGDKDKANSSLRAKLPFSGDKNKANSSLRGKLPFTGGGKNVTSGFSLRFDRKLKDKLKF